MIPADRVQDTQTYYFAEKLREIRQLQRQGREILNLGIGSPDLAPSNAVRLRLAEHALDDDVHGYMPYRGMDALRMAWADYLHRSMGVQLDPDAEITPVLGSKSAIGYISMAWLQPGRAALAPDPGYLAYAAAAKLAGGSTIPYRLREKENWLPRIERLDNAYTRGRNQGLEIGLLWLNTVHMPSGQVLPKALLEEILDWARSRQIVVVNDHPYAALSVQASSVLDSARGRIELHSLSKSHNLAGARSGAICGDADLLKPVFRVLSNFESGMYAPVQRASIEALQSPEAWANSIRSSYRQRRSEGERLMNTLDCSVLPGQEGMFIWARIPESAADDRTFTDELLHRCGVFITPGSVFGPGGEGHVRLSLCSPTETLIHAQEIIIQNQRYVTV